MLYLDFETYNAEKDISAGTYEYGRTAEPLILAYAIDDGPARVWDLTATQVCPPELERVLHEPTVQIVAHNAIFDRTILNQLDKTGAAYCLYAPERWRCTMVKALSNGFPGSLDQIGRILGLPQDKAKLKDGKRLIHRFCKPAPKNHKADRYDRQSHPKEWELFCDYAKRDVEAMREIDKRLPDWNYRGAELDLYHLDQRINDRGFRVDRDLVAAGAKAAVTEKQTLAERFVALTGGVVESPTQRQKFQNYLNATFGLSLKDTQAQTFRDHLKQDGVPAELRELMEISMMSNKTSTAKYASLEPAVSPDGRFRGGLQYAGAARTRRWAGRTFQPHNLPSRGLPDQRDIEQYIEALKAGVHDRLFDDLMLYGSAALRGALIAPEGKTLAVADLSNIEGRINAWLAGETWKLQAFEAFDRGEGPDLYKVTAGSLLGKTPDEVDKTERNIMGKVPELALGYEGGVGAFQTFSKAYGVKMADHWDTIRASLPVQHIEQAYANYDSWGHERSDVDRDEWLPSETVKLAWRDRHPAISALWRSCKTAASKAIKNPGKTYTAGPHLRFSLKTYAEHGYLLMRIPSGNVLVYFSPRLDADGNITYMGTNPLTRQWVRTGTYGGKLVENACQSLARDILAHSMPKIEGAGFEIVLTVHDEIITEIDKEALERRNADKLSELMATNPNWAPGLPLAAEGFVTDRYRK